MISMKLALGAIFALILLLMITVIILAIYGLKTKKYKFTGACVHLVFIMVITLAFTMILINSRYNKHIGGRKYTDIVDIHILSDEYYVELNNGRLIKVARVIYGEDTYIIEGTRLIEECILGFDVYTDTNLLVIKPSGVDLDTMAESEKKHYLTNGYIELK